MNVGCCGWVAVLLFLVSFFFFVRVVRCLSFVLCRGLSMLVVSFLGLLLFVVVCGGLLWFVVVCCGLLWFDWCCLFFRICCVLLVLVAFGCCGLGVVCI